MFSCVLLHASCPVLSCPVLSCHVIQMHENKYLHLPVVDEGTGNVLGVVSVMEIIQATAGEEGSTG